jgi:hypothetical protein
MAGPLLPGLPFELQEIIFSYLYDIDPSSYNNVLRLSKAHTAVLTPRLYSYICIRSHVGLEGLASTLLGRPEIIRYVRSFFFQGPQGRRRTGRDQLRLLFDTGDEEDAEENALDTAVQALQLPDDDMKGAGLESGIEGEGQEATWDEHESLMHLCTVILRLCSNHLESIGFVDCVPWFLAPAEGGALNFPLPSCKDFTGVTVGLFGLLPHLQRNKSNATAEEVDQTPTELQRIHLIGGDFGSFALQRVLVSSPSGSSLTHLHITAPTLYRPEHHSHLVMHIVGLLQNLPNLTRISVGFLHWLPSPPRSRSKASCMPSSDDAALATSGTGEDSFERGQLKGTGHATHSGHGPSEYDDRLTQCRQAYIRALPEALRQSKRREVIVGIVKLPFAEGSPVGFAGWVLSHHKIETRDRSARASNKEALRSWLKRDLTALPPDMASDGAPLRNIWQSRLAMEWSLDDRDQVQLIKGDGNDDW